MALGVPSATSLSRPDVSLPALAVAAARLDLQYGANRNGRRLRQTGDLVINRTGLATTYLQNQRTQIIEMLNRRLGVDAALEAVPSIGDEVKPARASRDRGGPPERRLNIDISGIE